MSGKKKRTVSIPKYDSAHDSGTTRSNDCILYLTEGDSAATMVRTGMSVVGRRKTGCFPLRGKILNVVGASARQISGNAEIQAVLKILGLSFSRKYDNAVDMATLRYGKVCMLADQVSGVRSKSGKRACGFRIAILNWTLSLSLSRRTRMASTSRGCSCRSSTTTGPPSWHAGFCTGSSRRWSKRRRSDPRRSPRSMIWPRTKTGQKPTTRVATASSTTRSVIVCVRCVGSLPWQRAMP